MKSLSRRVRATRQPCKPFLTATAGFIRYFSRMNGYYNADMENHIKTKLIESQMKFRFDR